MLSAAPKLHIDALEDVHFESQGTSLSIAPQADDLNKVLQLLLAIEESYTSSEDLASYFNFDLRQSNYYAEAAEYLGLVLRERGSVDLTQRGLDFIQSALDDKDLFMARAIVNSWIFQRLTDIARRDGRFHLHDIDQVIASATYPQGAARYGGTTIPRRRQTIIAWIKWLSERIGCYVYEPSGDAYTLG